MKLKIQMIPETAYGQNARSVLSPTKWRQLSRLVRNNSGCICEICGNPVEKISDMDAHEVWKYITVKKKNGKKVHIQRLIKIQAVCKNCHKVIHIGRTSYSNHYDEAVEWFLQVNQCGYSKFRKAEKKAYHKFFKRSKYKWKLDINKPYLEELLQESIG